MQRNKNPEDHRAFGVWILRVPQDAALPSTFSHPDFHRRLRTGRRVYRLYRIGRLRGSRARQAHGLPYRRSGIPPCPEDDNARLSAIELYPLWMLCQARMTPSSFPTWANFSRP